MKLQGLRYDSAPNFDLYSLNISKRKKDDLSSFMFTIQEMFCTSSAEQNRRIRDQNVELTKCIETISNKFNKVLCRINSLEKERKENKKIFTC